MSTLRSTGTLGCKLSSIGLTKVKWPQSDQLQLKAWLRPVDDEASELTMLTFQDSSGNERPDCVMLDPGASAFLSGYQPFRRYLQHQQECGFPVEKICMTQGRRRFQFGGDAASWSRLVGTFASVCGWALWHHSAFPVARQYSHALWQTNH